MACVWEESNRDAACTVGGVGEGGFVGLVCGFLLDDFMAVFGYEWRVSLFIMLGVPAWNLYLPLLESVVACLPV